MIDNIKKKKINCVIVKDIIRIDINKLDGLVELFDDLLHEYQHLTGYSDKRINGLCILLNKQLIN